MSDDQGAAAKAALAVARREAGRHRRTEARLAEVERSRDDAIRAAAVAGASRRAIAEAVGLSHQRVQQLVGGVDQGS